jgi:hypothetical protein
MQALRAAGKLNNGANQSHTCIMHPLEAASAVLVDIIVHYIYAADIIS